jgi:peptidoglycan hydrolase-like protein with peptidoglycan-binding domain
MSRALLRLNDGRDDTSPELKGDVRALQQALNTQGSALLADGVFGPETEAAVRRFQRAHGLLDHGVVGPLTWTALDTSPSLSAKDETDRQAAAQG